MTNEQIKALYTYSSVAGFSTAAQDLSLSLPSAKHLVFSAAFLKTVLCVPVIAIILVMTAL